MPSPIHGQPGAPAGDTDVSATPLIIEAPAFSGVRFGKVLFFIAVAFSAFQLFMAAYHVLPSQITRAFHVGFLCLLALPLFGLTSRAPLWLNLVAWALGLAAFGVAIYQWVFFADLLLRAGDPTRVDIVVGVVALALLFITAWRVMGPALPIISGIFLAYCLLGHLLPSPFNHRGYTFEQVIDHMAFGTEGIYGIPTLVSSTFIFLFILFGMFLERAGMIQLFTDVAMGAFGMHRGGPAKVAVVSSAFMGTISGSGVANVVTTGQFTIPLMKRFGYRPAFAGGVEATSSMGGQIMPPVMGAVAFIMAETIDVPYSAVVQAAIIPAMLYFASAFWMVHLEAGKRNLRGLPPDEIPSAMAAIRKGWHLFLPLFVLVFLLFSGYTPLYSGMAGLAFTVILILGGGIAQGLPAGVLRVLYWIALGLCTAAFFEYGVTIAVVTIAALCLFNGFSQGGRKLLADSVVSLAEGARTALPVGVACAIVGIIIGTMTLTGAATNFGQFIVSIGEKSLFLSLVLTMVTCLILGMGIPTIPNYIITSSLAGPALLELGVPLIVSHMFVFYYGILADLTPPVALAAFAAAPIAKESGLKIGLQAVKIAAAGFVVPFMAVYTPALMLQDGGPLAAEIGYPLAVSYIVFKAVLAVGLWGMAAIGYGFGPMPWWQRIFAVAAAAMLVKASDWSDMVGFAMIAVFFLSLFLTASRQRKAAAQQNLAE